MSRTGLIVFVVVFVPIFLIEMRRLRSQAEREVEWRRRIEGTSWRDRRRIAAATRRGERLDLPREADVAVLLAERQIAFNLTRRWTPRVVAGLGVGLALLGLLAATWTVFALGALFIVFGLLDILRSSRLTERLERAAKLNRQQASLGADKRDRHSIPHGDEMAIAPPQDN